MNLRQTIAIGCIPAWLLAVACSSDSENSGDLPEGGAGAGATGGGNNAGGNPMGNGGTGGGTSHNGGASGASTGGTTSSGGSTMTSSGGTATGGTSASTGGTHAAGGRSADAGVADSGDASMDAATPRPSDGGDGSSPESDTGRRPKRIFLTHDRWDGNLKRAAGNLGINVTTGLAAANALCNRSASVAGLGGTWVAWLSDGTHDAIGRVQDVGPWYRVDGAEVFHDKAALTGNPLVAIDLDETGADTEFVDAGGLAAVPWTGTLANGAHSADTCNDWVSSASDVHGLAGANTATTNAKWSEATSPLCDNPYHLYCFEQ